MNIKSEKIRHPKRGGREHNRYIPQTYQKIERLLYTICLTSVTTIASPTGCRSSSRSSSGACPPVSHRALAGRALISRRI